jgi:hypothetical protein
MTRTYNWPHDNAPSYQPRDRYGDLPQPAFLEPDLSEDLVGTGDIAAWRERDGSLVLLDRDTGEITRF